LTSPTGPAAGVHLPWAKVPDVVKVWALSLGCAGAWSGGDKHAARSRR
jgi:hypothetical protein